MKTAAIILAAGRGRRAGEGLAKQWRQLRGRPVVAHTLDVFRDQVDHLVLVIHPDDQEIARATLAECDCPAQLVMGGDMRAQSVCHALEALEGHGVAKVLIHDGARALVPVRVVRDVLAALEKSVAAAPALPVTDALWRGAQRGHATENAVGPPESYVMDQVDRTGLWRAQTPQGFHFEAILSAHRSGAMQAMDDVEVARAAGYDVQIMSGDEENIKLTFPEDFQRAEDILARREAAQERHTPQGSTSPKKDVSMDIRLGNGFDVHAFCEGDHLYLCGVRIAHDHGLLGHSDADVGMHALTDAIYGALADGDIGVHFPPSDPRWKGAESHIFLRHAIAQARGRGYRLSNCDITLICEAPKIAPHQEAMRASLAKIMDVPKEVISVKATTSERLGFAGRGEGIAALATAALVQP